MLWIRRSRFGVAKLLLETFLYFLDLLLQLDCSLRRLCIAGPQELSWATMLKCIHAEPCIASKLKYSIFLNTACLSFLMDGVNWRSRRERACYLDTIIKHLLPDHVPLVGRRDDIQEPDIRNMKIEITNPSLIKVGTWPCLICFHVLCGPQKE